MTDLVPRSTQDQSTQIGAEAIDARGTAVDCDTRLSSMTVKIKPNVETVQFGPTGQLWDSVVVTAKDKTEVTIEGQAVYDELPYPLASLVGDVDPTSAGGTATYDWVFRSAPAGGNDYRTYTVEQGDRERAARATQVTISEFGLEISRDGFAVDGSGIGKLFTDDVQMYRNEIQNVVPSGTMTAGSFTLSFVHPVSGSTITTGSIPYNATASQMQTAFEALSAVQDGDIYVSGGSLPLGTLAVEWRRRFRQANIGTMTVGGGSLTGGSVTVAGVQNGAEPTLLTLVPIVPGSVSVYRDATAGSIGTTKLNGVMMTSWRIAGRYGELWTLNEDETSWADLVDIKPETTFGLTAVADEDGMQPLAHIRSNDTYYYRIQANGPIIEGTLRYRMIIDMAAKVTAIDDLDDQDGAFAAMYVLTPVEDAALGYAFQISIRNTLAAL